MSASGKIQPKRLVNISADTMGKVTGLAVNEGDRVKKGQFLLQVDPRNLRSAVQSGEASLEAPRSQQDQLNATIELAPVIKQAQDNFTRQQQLRKGGLTTREMLDRAENEVKMRQAELRSQEQQVQTQKLRIQQEQATLDSDRYDLSKVRIESPINGIVTRRNIEEGETAVVGTMNNAGTVLLTIADMSVIEAEVEVDETDIPKVQLGQEAKITIDAIPEDVHRQGHRDRQQPDPETPGQAAPARRRPTSRSSSPSTARFRTCALASRARPRSRRRRATTALAVPIQAMTVREMVVDGKGEIVRTPDDRKPRRRRRRAGRRSSSRASRARSWRACSSCATARPSSSPSRPASPARSISRSLSGVKEGDNVIVGPFSSVRELGTAVAGRRCGRSPGAAANARQ